MADPAPAGQATLEDGPGEDIRPVVARSTPSNLGLWLFFAALLIGGVWLFSVMSANRADIERATITANLPDFASRIASPPPLALPRAFLDTPPAEPERPIVAPALSPAPMPRAVPAPAPAQVRIVEIPAEPAEPYTPPSRPAVVFDEASTPLPPAPSAGERPGTDARVRAGRLANPSLTVPQGTVVPAVLETALDSTRPGGVRALVQRDVHGFDGSRVLIPRGSRLYGEYDASLQAGQNRALVRWTRLLRPDGVTIALDSPASDPLGRAGIRGKVDGKFFQRFGGAILQSVLDIGVGVATREATDGVVVALPGTTQNIDVTQGDQVQRTLKVKHGASVSVFVARDLDFSSVDS
ncbi:conjugal transfer protein TrbI [Pelagerythrobacter rhizovicinus]|uniref:Conjugal transfer protein TrbI n=2 Tax=Pelagerythrobacter rhizovicinus TaxID=2268576 RepID=A0A4Q2KII1_9SPHN|nr:conjugal transfer protein TrbI [Pelagerythrobacter rhizovicinus]